VVVIQTAIKREVIGRASGSLQTRRAWLPPPAQKAWKWSHRKNYVILRYPSRATLCLRGRVAGCRRRLDDRLRTLHPSRVRVRPPLHSFPSPSYFLYWRAFARLWILWTSATGPPAGEGTHPYSGGGACAPQAPTAQRARDGRRRVRTGSLGHWVYRWSPSEFTENPPEGPRVSGAGCMSRHARGAPTPGVHSSPTAGGGRACAACLGGVHWAARWEALSGPGRDDGGECGGSSAPWHRGVSVVVCTRAPPSAPSDPTHHQRTRGCAADLMHWESPRP